MGPVGVNDLRSKETLLQSRMSNDIGTVSRVVYHPKLYTVKGKVIYG